MSDQFDISQETIEIEWNQDDDGNEEVVTTVLSGDQMGAVGVGGDVDESFDQLSQEFINNV